MFAKHLFVDKKKWSWREREGEREEERERERAREREKKKKKKRGGRRERERVFFLGNQKVAHFSLFSGLYTQIGSRSLKQQVRKRARSSTPPCRALSVAEGRRRRAEGAVSDGTCRGVEHTGGGGDRCLFIAAFFFLQFAHNAKASRRQLAVSLRASLIRIEQADKSVLSDAFCVAKKRTRSGILDAKTCLQQNNNGEQSGVDAWRMPPGANLVSNVSRRFASRCPLCFAPTSR